MDKLDRLFQLHGILARRRSPIGLADLAARMECSRPTVFRAISLLRDVLGAPIILDKERSGYVYEVTDQRYELPGLWFTAGELQALVILQRLLDESGSGLLQDHFALLSRRIDELTSRKQFNLSEAATRVRMPALAARPTGTSFQHILGATLQRKKLWLEYKARTNDQVSHRTISPQRVTRYRESWYLDAWDEGKKELRTFAIDRISQLRVINERATSIDEAVLDEHFGAGYGIFSGPARSLAILSFSPESARWVADEQWHPKQAGRFLPDGRYELQIPYGNSRELVMDILRHGPHVKVISPDSLRTEVQERLGQALAQYSAD